MGPAPLRRPIAVALIVFWSSGCVSTHIEKKKQEVNVATNPAGAEIYVKDDAGQRIVGNGPLSFSLEYREELTEFNGAWWTMLAASVVVLGTGIAFVVLGGTNNDGTNGTGPIDDAIGYSAGGSMIFVGGIGSILSAIFCGIASAKDGDSQVVSPPTTIGARLAGHEPAELKVKLPSPKKDLSLLLKPSSAPATVAVPAVQPKAARDIVAVFDIEDKTETLDGKTLVQLTAYLQTQMTQTGQFKTIPRDQLRARLLDQKTSSYGECFDESCQIQLGKALAAQKSVATSMIKVGDRCAVTANLFDLKTETVERGASVKTGCSTNELLDAIEKLAKQLAGQ